MISNQFTEKKMVAIYVDRGADPEGAYSAASFRL